MPGEWQGCQRRGGMAPALPCFPHCPQTPWQRLLGWDRVPLPLNFSLFRPCSCFRNPKLIDFVKALQGPASAILSDSSSNKRREKKKNQKKEMHFKQLIFPLPTFSAIVLREEESQESHHSSFYSHWKTSWLVVSWLVHPRQVMEKEFRPSPLLWEYSASPAQELQSVTSRCEPEPPVKPCAPEPLCLCHCSPPCVSHSETGGGSELFLPDLLNSLQKGNAMAPVALR